MDVRYGDTDFHSLDYRIRGSDKDTNNTKRQSVIIKENAFIGASSILLKGITIGKQYRCCRKRCC